jgi:hypothetical protein
MSFQGPGTGISGTSNQFSTGYSQSAGSATNATYAGSAGSATNATYAQSAGNINGYAPAAGNATYAQSAGSAGNATYAQSAGSATNINSANGINGSSWAWSGQPGTPGWLWGSNAAGQYAVWQPANITVGTANYTNGNIGGRAPIATYADYAGGAGNINGYAPAAGNATSVQSGNISINAGGYAPIYAGNYYGGRNMSQYNNLNNVNYGQIRGFYPAITQNLTGGEINQAAIGVHALFGIIGSYYVFASDKRAKKDLTDTLDKPQYLDKVEKLNVKNYKWINTIEKGDKLHTGFFAQDVESIIPEVIETTNDFIPTIYGPADIISENTVKYENHGLIEGDVIKYKQLDESTKTSNVITICNNSEFVLEEKVIGEDIFILGKRTNDFKTINMDNVVPYTVGAIQELTKRVKVLEEMLNVVSV